MLRSASSLLLVGCLTAGAVACSKDKEAKAETALGDPIGAEVQASGNVPALSLALAVGKGQDPVAHLPHIVGAVSAAVGGCPAFVTEQKESITAVPFTLEKGKMRVEPTTETAGLQCLASALDGKDIPSATSPDPIRGRVEIRMSATATKAP